MPELIDSKEIINNARASAMTEFTLSDLMMKLNTATDSLAIAQERLVGDVAEALSHSARCSLPSERFIDIAIQGTEQTYIAPADGIIAVQYTTQDDPATQHGALLINDTTHVSSSEYSVPGATMWQSVFVHVRKGDSTRIIITVPSSVRLAKFIYLEGSR